MTKEDSVLHLINLRVGTNFYLFKKRLLLSKRRMKN